MVGSWQVPVAPGPGGAGELSCFTLSVLGSLERYEKGSPTHIPIVVLKDQHTPLASERSMVFTFLKGSLKRIRTDAISSLQFLKLLLSGFSLRKLTDPCVSSEALVLLG